MTEPEKKPEPRIELIEKIRLIGDTYTIEFLNLDAKGNPISQTTVTLKNSPNWLLTDLALLIEKHSLKG